MNTSQTPSNRNIWWRRRERERGGHTGGDPSAGFGGGGVRSRWTGTSEKLGAVLGRQEGRIPWLVGGDGVGAAVKRPDEIHGRCDTSKNLSQTVRGYLAAIKYFHKMYGGIAHMTLHGVSGK